MLGNVSGFDSKATKTYQVRGQERRGSVGVQEYEQEELADSSEDYEKRI